MCSLFTYLTIRCLLFFTYSTLHYSVHHLMDIHLLTTYSHTVCSHRHTAQEECKIVIHRSQHPDSGPRDVLSYMLALASSLVPLSSSVSTVLRGKSYINHTTHYITNCT